jgi:hypothetical protein
MPLSTIWIRPSKKWCVYRLSGQQLRSMAQLTVRLVRQTASKEVLRGLEEIVGILQASAVKHLPAYF